MYLISLYFDEETEALLQKHIERVAAKTGNTYMLDNRIPPHITIASCGCGREDMLAAEMERVVKTWRQGAVEWVAVGSFKPHVLFFAPVLNSYLHELCVSANALLSELCGERSFGYYQPFRWFPHVTIARTLSEEQMRKGFQVLQANFQPFSGRAVEVGLAGSHPHQDIKRWRMPDN